MTADAGEPIALRIKLPFASEAEFIDKYGTNVARGGIFIATQGIKPEGTALSFELVLANGDSLLRGEGTVVKAQVDAGGRRRGMTVRFAKLDGRSKELVERVLAHRAHAVTPEAAAVVEAPPVEAAPPEPPPEPVRPPPPPPVAEAAPLEAPKRRRSLPEIPVVAAPPADAPPILGIHFGTAFLRAAVCEGGNARLLPLGPQGELAYPAVIYAEESGILCTGADAKAHASSDPRNGVFGLRRLLGQRMRAPGTRELAGKLPFALVEGGGGDAAVVLRGQPHSVPDLVARLLRDALDAARRAVGQSVSRVVLCVPSHFNSRQRAALLEAARQAQLQVARLVNEPTAVALAFGHGRGLARKRILVYALGGGGVDVSVVEVTGEDLDAVTTGGDAFLSDLVLENGAPPAGIAADLLERSLNLTRAALQAGGLKPDGLDELLVVGAQGRDGAVTRSLEGAFGKTPRTDLDPEGAVALGAALVGQAVAAEERGKGRLSVSDVLSAPIGVAVAGGAMHRVLERNTRLPAEKSLTFPVRAFEPFALAVFQGSATQAQDNDYLGTLKARPDKAGDLSLRFIVAAGGTLEVRAAEPGQKESAATLSAVDPGEEGMATLLANAPAPGGAPAPRGLFTGLKRLFGRP
jgi:molecular chaperone DnaK